jgi:F-type H+-transporting ATPase subunit delta
MFRGRLSDIVLNTLQVMNDHNRVHLLEPLLRAFTTRAQEAAGEVEARAVTAVALDDAQKDEVRKLAATLSGKKPLMQYEVDAALVGGLVLRVGDCRYDNSVRRRLEQARGQLVERGSAGLPSTIREG